MESLALHPSRRRPEREWEMVPSLSLPVPLQPQGEEEPLLSYQKWLHLEAVKNDGNGVIVLPTGTGKTRVAFEIIMTALRRHRDRAVVFLCPNVNLVVQQANYFERICVPKLKVENITIHLARAAGGSGKAEIEKLKNVTNDQCASFVLFATGGTFRNFLEDNGSDAQGNESAARAFGRMSLLVLDECHHASRLEGSNVEGETNHDYARIMQFYQDKAVDILHRPKMIGLTASPGETKTDIINLAATLMAKICYPTWPPALVVELEQKTQSTTTYPLLVAGGNHTLWNLLKTLSAVKNAERKVSRKICSGSDVEAIRGKKDCVCAEELFRCIGWGDWLDALCTNTDACAEFGPLFTRLNAKAMQINGAGSGASPLLREVTRELLCALERPKPLRAVVFVTSIIAAKLMQQVLNKLHPRIQVGILTGQQELTKAQQTEAVKQFNSGTFNVLVANSVAEEGLDIQACNLVIRTEPPTSIIRNIQGRGRARQADARYVIMCLDYTEIFAVHTLRRQEDAAMLALKTLALGMNCGAMSPTVTSWSRFTPQRAGAGVNPGQLQGHISKCLSNFSDYENADEHHAQAAGGVGGGAVPGGLAIPEARGAQSNPPFDLDADYKSQLNWHIQSKFRPNNSTGYAAIQYIDHIPTGPPHLLVFTASVSYDRNGPYRGDPCSTKRNSHQSAAWRALQAEGMHI